MYELYHHGILGQRWGKKNGPPYPLGASDHSASEKKAGWRKSLGVNKKVLKRVNEIASQDKSSKLLRNHNNHDTYIKEIYGGVKVIDKDNELIPKGITFNRVAGDEPIDSSRKYVSLESTNDSNAYADVAEILPIEGENAYQYTYKAKKDLKVASEKQISDYIVENYGDTKLKDLSISANQYMFLSQKGKNVTNKLLRKMKNVSVGELYKNQNEYDSVVRTFKDDYHTENGKDRKAVATSIIAHESFRLLFNKHMMQMPENRDAIFNEFKKRGYDAIVDVEDKTAGFNYPLIILDPKKSLSMVSKKQFDVGSGMYEKDIRENPHAKVTRSRIKSLQNSGMTYEQIAKKLDLSTSTVARVLTPPSYL